MDMGILERRKMDLIDREKLLNHLKNRFLFNFDDVIMKIKMESSIDAIPVIKSKWNATPDGWIVCQRCYKRAFRREWIEIYKDLTPNYCPNCGAQMIEEASDETK